MPVATKQKRPAPKITNAFVGSRAKPTAVALSRALGSSAAAWEQVVVRATREFGLMGEWKSISPKYGWSLRLKKKERNILYLSPARGYFLVLLILGERAVVAAKERGLPAAMRRIINQAPKYPEGTGVRIPVKNAEQMEDLMELVRIKLEN